MASGFGERLPCPGFGGQMHHDLRRTVASKAAVPRVGVSNVSGVDVDTLDSIARALRGVEPVDLRMVRVEEDDVPSGACEHGRESRADESGAAGDQCLHAGMLLAEQRRP